ncbi:hypothetical protein ACT6QH_13005 [Xanthobacter sp. TB0139]|uniref:hypothetical protein n=1 Tax=Xanthobacter sp. TB0139 TaxID=3459178 RepID=UPI004039F264
MSTHQSSQAQSQRFENDPARQAQSQQWHTIGIPAVAAAARQAGEQQTVNSATPKSVQTGGTTPKRIVTLREIDHLFA